MLGSDKPASDDLHIQLMPMIDIILCLLIFFMAATKLYDWNEQQLDVMVPEVAAAKPLTEAPADVLLKITYDEAITLDGQPIEAAQISQRLRKAVETYPDRGVLIRGDGRVQYRRVAELMSACEEAGIRRIAVSVRELTSENN